MKLYCPKCKKTITRDARLRATKAFITAKGYKTFCEKTGKNVFLKIPNQTP